MKPGLGTQLRHLIDLLDGAVGAAYEEAGLDYRPRYTPVMRALTQGEARTIGQIAESAGITQPAATQTIALMLKAGLIVSEPGALDGRQKMISLSAQGRALLPQLQQCWQATAAAARSLDEDLPYPLSDALANAIAALRQQSFGERIRAARSKQK
ncbi:MarR family transcriptional regulator [Massilia sp. FT127W]|uniref:MarR family transcriptional regulator n=1 Tax=Pseudoduganella aquatica TaxID=2660641 RepID=A0A7X4KNX7_9BURK|nr:MarR family transcriptional regulator [Pseudoduganella aquatica]